MNLPQNAALMPKKKIANENANSIWEEATPISIAMLFLIKDQQYTLPMQQCIKRAGIAPLSHLLPLYVKFNVIFSYSPVITK